MMRCLKIAAAAAMTFAFAAVPAFGAVVINAGDTGYNFTVDYTGLVGGNVTPSVSALGTYTFTGVSNDGLTYNFNYSLTNDSTTTARLSGFAFDTSPNPTGGTVTGAFNQVNSGNYPEGYGSVDICFTDAGGSCAGGGSGGYYQNNTGTGTFAVTFAQVMSSVSFDDFVTRFQSISGAQGGNSGIGTGALVSGGSTGTLIAAPEPGTWLMMLGGFGLVGWASRRRRESAAVLQLA